MKVSILSILLVATIIFTITMVPIIQAQERLGKKGEDCSYYDNVSYIIILVYFTMLNKIILLIFIEL